MIFVLSISVLLLVFSFSLSLLFCLLDCGVSPFSCWCAEWPVAVHPTAILCYQNTLYLVNRCFLSFASLYLWIRFELAKFYYNHYYSNAIAMCQRCLLCLCIVKITKFMHIIVSKLLLKNIIVQVRQTSAHRHETPSWRTPNGNFMFWISQRMFTACNYDYLLC